MAVLPSLLELYHCQSRVDFLVTLYQGILHNTLAVVPSVPYLDFIGGQPAHLNVGCLLWHQICLGVVNDADLGPTTISMSITMSAVILTRTFKVGWLNELFWVLLAIKCSTTTCVIC